MAVRPSIKSIHRQVREMHHRGRDFDLATLTPREGDFTPRFQAEVERSCRDYENSVKRIQDAAYCLKYHTHLEPIEDR